VLALLFNQSKWLEYSLLPCDYSAGHACDRGRAVASIYLQQTAVIVCA
jgi:hypothetical protein